MIIENDKDKIVHYMQLNKGWIRVEHTYKRQRNKFMIEKFGILRGKLKCGCKIYEYFCHILGINKYKMIGCNDHKNKWIENDDAK